MAKASGCAETLKPETLGRFLFAGFKILFYPLQFDFENDELYSGAICFKQLKGDRYEIDIKFNGRGKAGRFLLP